MTSRTSTKPTTRPALRRLMWLGPSAVVVLVVMVLAARWLIELPSMRSFLHDYPGHVELSSPAAEGLPAWLGWQHFLNLFFLVLIVKTGWQVRTVTKPPAHWTRNNQGLIRTKGAPTKISLHLWLHLTMDFLWVLNGALFVFLIFVSGHWRRIVPTSWDVFPNALSAGIQYLSLNWPMENGWVNYNSLQMIAYFVTVFIAAPLAIITGVRMSGAWPKANETLNRVYPVTLARRLHLPVMVYFVLFTFTHVTLVMATGMRRNLNHIFAGRDDESWIGLVVFSGSLLLLAAVWVLARPLFLRPIASWMGKVSR